MLLLQMKPQVNEMESFNISTHASINSTPNDPIELMHQPTPIQVS